MKVTLFNENVITYYQMIEVILSVDYIQMCKCTIELVTKIYKRYIYMRKRYVIN